MTARPVCQYPDLDLLPQHEKLLADSGILPHVANARGYESATTKARLKELGFSEPQRRVPALVLPIYSAVTTEVVMHQARPDEPRRDQRSRPVKYETPRGVRMAIDCNPIARLRLKDPSGPLFITEGVRKADAAVSHGLCCAALLGVWNFRGRNEFGGLTALSDWESIALKDRTVYIVFDSDVMEKPEVYGALVRLKALLEGRGARVLLIYLPPGEGGAKVGLDDYLAAGHTVQDILALATSELRGRPDDGDDARYRATPTGLFWIKRTAEGAIEVPLTNFVARIASQVMIDDGVETRREYEIEAHLGGRVDRFLVRAEEFARMEWVTSRLGAQAILPAGATMRDRTREAIQFVSRSIAERRVFAHTGWRGIAGQPAYLHGGGAIGPAGPLAGVEIRLPEALTRFALPAPPVGGELRDAIRASLRILDAAPDRITAPLLAAAYRAPLGAADFALHITGETGAMKTTLAALAQQHFGCTMDAAGLPAHWSSTANALEEVAFAAKDAVLVVDDFAPSGSAQDVQRLHREADRLFRAAGNQAGRQRMRADTTLRPERPPRALIVSTGEEVPRAHSVRARTLLVELRRGGVEQECLTVCQQAAARGACARAMAGYVRWLAAHHAGICEALIDQAQDLQAAVQGQLPDRAHPRTPRIIAHLAAGMLAFLLFAWDAGTLSGDEAERLWRREWEALFAAGMAQGAHQAEADSVPRFLDLLVAVLESGHAHVAGADGTSPPEVDAGAQGWRSDGGGIPRPQGVRIGWVEGDDLYLIPDAAYAEVQRLAKDQGEWLGVDRATMGRRLRDRGVLVSPNDEHLTVKRTSAGGRIRVWHLHFSKILTLSSDQQPGQPGYPSATLEIQGRASGPPAPPLRQTRWGRAILGPTESRDPVGPESASQPPRRDARREVGQREALSIKASSATVPPAPLGTPGESKTFSEVAAPFKGREEVEL